MSEPGCDHTGCGTEATPWRRMFSGDVVVREYPGGVFCKRCGWRLGESSLTDAQIFRGAIIALSDLWRTSEDHPRYGAYRAAAVSWVNEAQERLADRQPQEEQR